MKIIITMAGEGSRFRKAGFAMPKYEIEVCGKTLFEWSLLSLKNFFKYEFIFVVRSDFDGQAFVTKMASKLNISKFSFFVLDKLTSGQAETLYLAIKDMANSEILVSNIDTAIQPRALSPERINAKYWWVTADMKGESWSFAQMDKQSKLIQTSEKKRISSYASLGIYYFHSSKEFIKIYDEYANIVKSEWKETYIAPFYNYIDRNDFDILHLSKEFVFCLGTPDEVEQNKERLKKFDQYPEVSMVLTHYNGWQYLDNIISRFNAQIDAPSKELIIVDNGSELRCPKETFKHLKDNIILIEKDYGNIGFGRQVAIDNALGDYVTIVDVDDSFEDAYIKKMLTQAKNTNSDLINAVKVDFDFSKNLVIKKTVFSKKGKIIRPESYPHNRLFSRNLLQNLIVSKVSGLDDISFVPIAISRAKKISECNAEYFWKTDLTTSSSRGNSVSRMHLFISSALLELQKNNKSNYVKFIIAWGLLMEFNERGIIKMSKLKMKMFWPKTADGWFCNFLIIIRRLGILKIFLWIREKLS